MNKKELRKSHQAAIARDKEWLEKIEPVLQKASPQDPLDRKIAAPMRGLKRALLRNLKIHEKILGEL